VEFRESARGIYSGPRVRGEYQKTHASCTLGGLGGRLAGITTETASVTQIRENEKEKEREA